MKRYLGIAALALGALFVASGCIMEDKVIEIVLYDKTCGSFEESHIAAAFVTPATIDFADEVDVILEDNDLSREDLYSARVVSGSYIVTYIPPGDHDWVISGYISVERKDIVDGPATLLNYTSQSVMGAMAEYQTVPLVGAGTELLDRALADYIAGENPVIEFAVHNGNVVPQPSEQDPIEFEWDACVTIFVTTLEEIETPDPF